ncbi:MAG: VanZ family protein [Clostridia bacterium]|nr:VanZ family protein [Clostridia bacterium]
MRKKFLIAYEIVVWTLVVLCAIMISSMSSQNAEESTSLSFEVTDVIVRIISPDAQIDRNEAEYLEKNNLVRQLAHAAEYALLGFLLLTVFAPFKSGVWKKLLIAIGVCAIFACFDEWRQSFVDGRGSEITDVLTDIAGSLAGCLAALAVRGVLLLAANKGAFWRLRD